MITSQNKWHYSPEDPEVDITDQFHEHVDRDHTLSKIFASVQFLRIPHSEYSSKLAEASRVLRDAIFNAAFAVRQRRQAHGTLYTEAEWWTLAPLVAEEYSRARKHEFFCLVTIMRSGSLAAARRAGGGAGSAGLQPSRPAGAAQGRPVVVEVPALPRGRGASVLGELGSQLHWAT